MTTIKCGHFLRREHQKALRAYARQINKQEGDYERLIKELNEIDPYAFHNKDSVWKRVFFHCPTTEVPYSKCYIKAK